MKLKSLGGNVMFWTRDREAGNKIDKFKTIEEARMEIQKYEKQDNEDGFYEENFYEIYDEENDEIVES